MNHFLITIDVEDWFQVENLCAWNPFPAWGRRELRVEANVNRLLDLFDSFKPPRPPASRPQAQNVPAPCPVRRAPSSSIHCTFFVLGWLADRLPHLVREIAARGHEVASHGSSHRMCRPLPDAELRDELAGSKRLLEDITGAEVAGFRAPNFSVDDRLLALIREAGYRYDSSYNNFALHGRYGRISLNVDRLGIAHRLTDDFFELPISNLPLSYLSILGTIGNLVHFRHFPLGGGAYFRLMPLSVFQTGVRSILNRDGAYLFYMHPWEVDPGQPRVRQASLAVRFMHYTNLVQTEDKLRKMIERFGSCCFTTCRDYLDEMAGKKVHGTRCRAHGARQKLYPTGLTGSTGSFCRPDSRKE
jgi:polysaccharide deacetylase family protein (PEP-CTERM system associated)